MEDEKEKGKELAGCHMQWGASKHIKKKPSPLPFTFAKTQLRGIQTWLIKRVGFTYKLWNSQALSRKEFNLSLGFT